ncbi:hypothetical protein BGX31_009263, partial [Mortierella sp. GBA43]
MLWMIVMNAAQPLRPAARAILGSHGVYAASETANFALPLLILIAPTAPTIPGGPTIVAMQLPFQTPLQPWMDSPRHQTIDVDPQWQVLGPFPTGMREQDFGADPLEAF